MPKASPSGSPGRSRPTNEGRLSPRGHQDLWALRLPDGTDVPYRVRRHARARRITLRVTNGGLSVTAPARAPAREIRAAIDARRDWIAHAFAQARRSVAAPVGLNDRIPLLGGALEIVAGGRGGVRRTGDRLAVPSGASVPAAIEAWYRRAAREHFGAVMSTWAPRIDVQPARLSVRAQRSRWGSASARGTISINWRLMMAPPEIGEYVMVHELVHLRHMDHSPEFWACVAAHWPSHRTERAWLRGNGAQLMAGPAALDAPRPAARPN